jgi:transcriptional regulator with XRE-family HTH domain
MDLKEFRQSRNWTLARAAEELGLRSKGYVSDLEKSGAASRPVALRLYRDFGVKVPPLSNLSDEEIALLAKLEGDRAA